MPEKRTPPYVELACGCIVQVYGGWIGVVEWHRLYVTCPNGHKRQSCVRQVAKPEQITEGS